MRPFVIAATLAVLTLAGCAGGADGLGREKGIPSDVNRFLKDRAACARYSDDSFSLLDDGDSVFGTGQGRMYCSGGDANLARLRTKYAGNTDVLRALDRLEKQIAEGDR